ncbi:MAG: sulfatase, partial [Acidobacteriota bacterium]
MRRTVMLGVSLILVLIQGCGRAPGIAVPLVDSDHPPVVLTERRVLALPNAPPGTRLVRGWRFEKTGSGLAFRPGGSTSSIEVVQLAARERELVLQFRDPGIGDRSLSVSARGPAGELRVTQSDGEIAVRLPANLGPGRVPIELEFSAPVVFTRALVSRAAPRGHVEIEGADVRQSGWSAVDFVRWVEAGTRLVGDFEAPIEVNPRQRFSISIDTGEDATPAVYDLATRSPGEPGRVRSFELPLRSTSGLVRIRLTARGPGSAGRWHNLRLDGESATAAHATESAPDPPRVLLVYVLDALRADFVDNLGATIGASPCIDRLASAGAVFTNHFSVAPNTGPATKSLFTGHGFLQGRALSPSGPETLAEVFTEAGFVTASFSSNPHLTPGFGLTRGFEHFEYLPIVQDHRRGGKVVVNDSAERVHRAALRWLDNRAVDESLFLYLHTLHPHNPYTPPRPFPRRFVNASAKHLDGRTRTLASIRDAEREVTLEDQKWLRQRYAANLAYNDAELCTLMEEIQRRFPGEAMVVITSDHGEELFDHDGVLHGYTLYDEMLHVPMVVWWPGVVPHTVVAEPTDTLDLHASL